MKIRKNLKTNYLINCKAQAILELATFGSMVLFCLALLIHFGLQMNYQQNVQMQAFRKALKLAYYKQGPGSSSSFTMVKDKPVVDPRDRWGFADRVTVGGGGSVTWDNNINGIYVADNLKEPDVRDLSRMYIEVDKTMRLDDSEVDDNVDNIGIDVAGNKILPQAREKGIFTTASFANAAVAPGQTIRIYLDNPKNEHGVKGYYFIDRKVEEIKVFEDEDDPRQHIALYLGDEGLTRRLASVDLTPYDGKLRQVNIIAVRGNKACDDDKYCGTLAWIRYIEPAGGDIDTYYADVGPRDKDKGLEDQQGLLMDSQKKFEYGSGARLITTEADKAFSTRTESAATQTITHKIRLQKLNPDGTVVRLPDGRPVTEIKDVNVAFQPSQTYDYEVQHE